jgi:hypothetical protein
LSDGEDEPAVMLISPVPQPPATITQPTGKPTRSRIRTTVTTTPVAAPVKSQRPRFLTNGLLNQRVNQRPLSTSTCEYDGDSVYVVDVRMQPYTDSSSISPKMSSFSDTFNISDRHTTNETYSSEDFLEAISDVESSSFTTVSSLPSDCHMTTMGRYCSTPVPTRVSFSNQQSSVPATRDRFTNRLPSVPSQQFSVEVLSHSGCEEMDFIQTITDPKKNYKQVNVDDIIGHYNSNKSAVKLENKKSLKKGIRNMKKYLAGLRNHSGIKTLAIF